GTLGCTRPASVLCGMSAERIFNANEPGPPPIPLSENGCHLPQSIFPLRPGEGSGVRDRASSPDGTLDAPAGPVITTLSAAQTPSASNSACESCSFSRVPLFADRQASAAATAAASARKGAAGSRQFRYALTESAQDSG